MARLRDYEIYEEFFQVYGISSTELMICNRGAFIDQSEEIIQAGVTLRAA